MTADPNRLDLLEGVPLFSCFDANERRQLAALFVEVSFRKGDVICREGDVGDTFYVIESGEVEVWGGGTPSRVFARMGRGEFIGEMSLLHSGKRSNTVTAGRPTRLLALEKAAFDRYFRNNPKVLDYFSKLLCRRLASATHDGADERRCIVIGVCGSGASKGRTVVAAALTALLREITGRDALLLDVRGDRNADRSAFALNEVRRAPSRVRSQLLTGGDGVPILAVSVATDDETAACADALGRLVTELGTSFPYLVVDCAASAAAAAAAVDEVCDVVVRIEPALNGAAPGAGPASYTVLNLHNPATGRVPVSHCQPFVLPADPSLAGLDARALAEHVVAHPHAGISPALHRLARKILGTSVGIAMGGGAAYGLATIGALKVLEDNGVPVDLVTGCSMGSICALGYALGIRAGEMIDIARRIANKTTTMYALLDVTFTQPGLLSGRRLVHIFSPFLGGGRTFEHLTLPCQVVATDIESGDLVRIDTGPLDRAFRASCSVPMLWTPVVLDGRVLVDGGVVDPVPVDVLRDMGADFCIGVNAVPHLRRGVQTVISQLYGRLRRLDPFAYLSGSHTVTNTFDCIMNTIQTLQHELGHFKAISADVRVNPDLSAFTWIEFYRAMEIIERGAEAAERALPEIKQRLAERIAPRQQVDDVTAVEDIVAEESPG